MPGVTRKDDVAGGAITNTQTKVKVNGRFVIVVGDPVAAHAPGGVHNAATMVEKSSKFLVAGKGVCRAGDKASCNDPANGSSNVLSG
jgi:uncharacterized Zn-binding protein involved in type VI secretion